MAFIDKPALHDPSSIILPASERPGQLLLCINPSIDRKELIVLYRRTPFRPSEMPPEALRLFEKGRLTDGGCNNDKRSNRPQQA
jgi:hypothetical protein